MEPEERTEAARREGSTPVGPVVEDNTLTAVAEPQPKGIVATFREAFRRAQDGHQGRHSKRRQPSQASESDRSARNRDRTKTLFGMVAALVVLMVVFLGVFSSSQSDPKREPATRRGQPNLGRPEDRQGSQGARPGSVTPLLSADLNANQQAPADQVSPEDIGGTARNRTVGEMLADGGQQSLAAPNVGRGRGNNGYELGNVQFDDPALDAYRRQLQASASMPPSAAPASTSPPQAAPPPAPPSNPSRETEALY